MTTVTPRERFHQIMSFECPGCNYPTLAGMWPSTLERWHREGMPAELDGVIAITEHFGLWRHNWRKPEVALWCWPEFPYEVVRETEETITSVDPHGIVRTDLKTDMYKSMPHFESFPVHNRGDWERYRERLRWSPDRIGDAWAAQVADLRADADIPAIMALNRIGSLYGSLRDMVGMEALSYLFYDDPELVAEMMDTVVELFCQTIPAVFADYVPDAICLWEDMGYKSGSLLSIRHVREFMLPRYRVMVQTLRNVGVPYILLDSDGDIHDLIPIWLEAGIDGLVPMEVQSGMDVAACRQRWPRLLMLGGIDKTALAVGPPAIDREMDKIRRTIASGGLIPWFDHGLPHNVSYENFLYFVQQLKDVG